jgi:hypothetical protein
MCRVICHGSRASPSVIQWPSPPSPRLQFFLAFLVLGETWLTLSFKLMYGILIDWLIDWLGNGLISCQISPCFLFFGCNSLFFTSFYGPGYKSVLHSVEICLELFITVATLQNWKKQHWVAVIFDNPSYKRVIHNVVFGLPFTTYPLFQWYKEIL